MRSRSMVSALLVIAVPLMLVSGAAAVDDKAQEETAIRELANGLEASHNKHDAKAFAALFSAEGDFTSVRGMTAHGRMAIEEFHRPLFEGDTSKGNPSFKHAVLELDEVKVRFIRPDVASVDILWTQTGSIAPDGKDRGTRKGLASWVVAKDDGRWQVVVMHNMDLPVQPDRPK